MPTQNKTQNLGLNSWLGTDKPKRSDFVEDNTILDTVITNHFNDTSKHLSAAEKALLTNPFTINIYVGNGESSRTYTFDFTPKIVFVFLAAVPFSEYDSTNNYTLCNSAVVANGYNNTLGASLSSNVLTVRQSTSASNGRFINLNKNGGQYILIAFK